MPEIGPGQEPSFSGALEWAAKVQIFVLIEPKGEK
jgi:hypothetical protein